MEAGRHAFNPRSQELYSPKSVSLSMISKLTSLMASAVGWSSPNNVTSTTLSHVWYPHAMARVVGRENPYGAVSVSASSKEGESPPHTMT